MRGEDDLVWLMLKFAAKRMLTDDMCELVLIDPVNGGAIAGQ